MEMKAIDKAPGAVHAFIDLGRAFRMWYERIVPSFIFASAWWALAFIAAQMVLFVATPLMLLPASVIWAVAGVFQMALANRAVHLEDFDIRSLFAAVGRLLWRYLGLFLLSIGAFLLYLPVLLYLPAVGGLMAYIGFGIASWVGLFSFVTAIYAAGIMAEHEERLFRAVYKGFLLMLDNPSYSLTDGVLLLLFGAAGYVLPIVSMTWSSWAYLVLVMLGVFFYGSVNAYFISYSVRRLLARYGLDRKGGRERMQEELLKDR